MRRLGVAFSSAALIALVFVTTADDLDGAPPAAGSVAQPRSSVACGAEESELPVQLDEIEERVPIRPDVRPRSRPFYPT